MFKQQLALALMALAILPGNGSARDKKVSAGERVSQLISVLQSDRDEEKRADAAEQLRYVDPAKHPEIVSPLITSMKSDPKASVRSEAAYSLSRLRPVSQEIGAALEEAQHDSSMRVRWQARNALLTYRLAGYRSAPKDKEPVVKAQTPPKLLPTAKGAASAPATSAKKPFVSHSNGETAAPPLAEVVPIPQTSIKPVEPPILPFANGPATTPAKPATQGPKLFD